MYNVSDLMEFPRILHFLLFGYRLMAIVDQREEAFFVVTERKILITHKKVNKRAYWLVKNTPHFHLNLNLRNAQLVSFFRLYFYCSLDQDLKSQCR